MPQNETYKIQLTQEHCMLRILLSRSTKMYIHVQLHGNGLPVTYKRLLCAGVFFRAIESFLFNGFIYLVFLKCFLFKKKL